MNRRHTILVVDDEPDVVQSVQDLLRREFTVVGAHRAQEAIDILKSREIHVVMTDQRMPGMSGVEFLSHVRGENPDAIRLLFTGYADIKAVVDAINHGNVFRYITKPWDPEELQGVIRQAGEQYDLLVERKRLLKELQQKNEELEAANAQLRAANELKAAFIKVASHELRTPLTIMLGLTELALETPGVPADLKPWLENSLKAGLRLNYLVDQLTKMLAAGKFERSLEKASTEVQSLLWQAVEDVQPFVRQRHQGLNVDIPPGLGTVHVERDKIRDCIAHLLLNAVKFTPDGGTIRLAARRRDDGCLEIQVADTGVGIEPDCLPYLFTPFFTRFNVSQHSSGQFEFNRRGMGLGLSLVKAFVEMHGGKVEVASEQNRGTTFTITLPPD